MRTRLALISMLLLTMGLVACGDDDGEAADTTTSSSTTAAPTTDDGSSTTTTESAGDEGKCPSISDIPDEATVVVEVGLDHVGGFVGDARDRRAFAFVAG